MSIRKIAAGFIIAGALLIAPRASFAQDTYAIDPAHSVVIFKINHLGMSDFYGRFNDISGSITVDPADAAKSKVNVEIKVAGADTHEAKRDEHLKGPDFFNSKQFPKITFESTGITKTGDKTFDVTGNLTVKGTTKPVTLKATKGGAGTDPWGKQRMGFNAEVTVKRSEFGVNFMPDKLGDDVTLLVSVEAVK